MLQIGDYILDSLLAASEQYSEGLETNKHKVELSGDEKLERAKKDHPELYKILKMAAAYKTYLRYADSLVTTRNVMLEKDEVAEKEQGAWINEWLELYVLYIGNEKTVSQGLADLQKEFRDKHQEVLSKSKPITQELDSLNDCSDLFAKMVKSTSQNEALSLSKELAKKLQIINNDKEVKVPYKFIKERSEEITAIINGVNECRKNFEKTFKENFQMIADKEKGQLENEKLDLQSRNTKIDSEIAANDYKLREVGQKISALDSTQRS